MIIQSIFQIFFDLASFIISLLPDISQFVDERFGGMAFVGLMQTISWIIPINTVFNCIIIGIMFYNAKFTVSVINWIIRKIPTIS